MATNRAQYTHEEARQRFDWLVEQCVAARTQRLGGEYGEQVGTLAEFMRTKTEFLSAPASSYYHLCIPGGLVIHSVAVAETALMLRNLLAPALSWDSVVLCGLFHDCGKVWSHTQANGSLAARYVKNSDPRAKASRPYLIADGDNGIDPTIKNLLLVHRFVELSDAEAQCLFYSDGPHVPVSKSAHHRQHPLSLLVSYADEWNGRVVESDVSPEWLSGMLARQS